MSSILVDITTVLGLKSGRVRPVRPTPTRSREGTPNIHPVLHHHNEVFGAEISGNRVQGGQLSDRQRDFAIAKLEAGCKTREVAEDLGCSQRVI
jgi:hypothetical protein